MFAQSEVKWDDPGFSQIWALYDSDLTQGPIWLRFDTQVTLFESWSGTLTQVQHVLFTISGLSLFDNFDTFWQLWSSKKRQKFVLLTTTCLSCRKSDWGESFCAATRVFRKCKGVQMLMIIVIVVFCNCILLFLSPQPWTFAIKPWRMMEAANLHTCNIYI